MGPGGAICRAAATLIGTPFRLHGRCDAGVDCVGLLWLSLCRAGLSVPDPPPYRLRAGVAPMVAGWMAAAGFGAGTGRRPGDLVVVRVSALQPHLLIDTGDAIIHAHAGLGRVVRMAMPAEWPELSRWRRAIPEER
ncbi:C40 family peptidase [Sphingobium sufflavum]|uniref:C40 family peptidase n=1 Tax=Sphingobium sufflavum TaxID=1129547 RepID=UPI001F46B880|nr:C40 family peptidase [Sphingobium sufflavum]MCE7798642.1 C40 family peptidase [Sphingobium sufflavum]